VRLRQQSERLIWAIITIALLGVALASFRAYTAPDFLLDFAGKMFLC
jgi:hypothetical protein